MKSVKKSDMEGLLKLGNLSKALAERYSWGLLLGARGRLEHCGTVFSSVLNPEGGRSCPWVKNMRHLTHGVSQWVWGVLPCAGGGAILKPSRECVSRRKTPLD